MCENGSTEDNKVCNSAEKTEEEASEVRVLTQEAVNEQMKRFFAPPLTRQLEELTRLDQGLVTTPHPSHYPRANHSAISDAAVHQPDNRNCIECF